ncbi:MAG: (d)CMP kinase [Alphaproteobacteria bacterium]|nr:(d)CMP kinase [Alphaproteobacteria bacterium]
MIITIDGPAAAGKGTLSSYLAKEYKLAYFDTGMVYRAVGLQMVLTAQDLSDVSQAEKIAKQLTFQQMMELSRHPDFRSDIGGHSASVVSSYPGVRQALLAMQQNFEHNPVYEDGTPARGVVYDGRDTGTVICPQADIKFFVTASPEVRAKRRYKEYVDKGIQTTYDKVLEDVIARDKRDSSRATAPMKPAEDAILVDTSFLNIDEVKSKVIPLIEAKLKNQ